MDGTGEDTDGTSEAVAEEDVMKKNSRERKEEEEEELERLAMEAILQEAKRGKARAERYGPSGWQKCHLPKTNKRYLNAVLTNAMVSNSKRMKPDRRSRKSRK